MHKDQQLSSIIISHDVKASLEISDYVAFLNRGKEKLPILLLRMKMDFLK